MSRLNFSGYGGVSLPVEVRRWNMRLVRCALTSDTVELEPGAYVAQVRFPDGRRARQPLQLPAGAKQTVSFYRAPREGVDPSETHPVRPRLTLQLVRLPHALELQMSAAGNALLKNAHTHIRCYAGNILQGEYRAARPRTAIHAERATSKVTRRLLFPFGEHGGDLQPILQIARRGALGVYCIPPHGASELDMRFSDASLQVKARLRDKSLQAILEFLWRGDRESAFTLAARRVQSAQGASETPHLSVLYALLGANALEWLREWAGLLADSPYGADGAAILGELYARLGQPSESLQALLRIAHLGLPAYTEGFIWAINRLRAYVAAGDAFPAEQREAATMLLQSLSAFEPCIDYAQPFLTYTGRRPDAPAEP